MEWHEGGGWDLHGRVGAHTRGRALSAKLAFHDVRHVGILASIAVAPCRAGLSILEALAVILETA